MSSKVPTKLRLPAIGVATGLLAGFAFVTWLTQQQEVTAGLSVVARADAERIAVRPPDEEPISTRESASPSAPPNPVPSPTGLLGPLPADQVDQLLARLGSRDRAVDLARSLTRAESGKVADYRDYLLEKCTFEKVLAAERMMREGTYFTTPASGVKLPAIPESFANFGIVAFDIDGKPINVWFLIDLHREEGSGVLQAMDALHEFESRRLDATDWRREDEDVRKFNAKDFELRKALIEASDAASRQLRDWPQASSRLSPEALAIREKLLPRKFVVDHATFTVQKRLEARYH